MNYQDKVKDQMPSAFFADGVASRAPIDGTVAEEMPAKDNYWSTGRWDDTHWGDGHPGARRGERRPAAGGGHGKHGAGPGALQHQLRGLPRARSAAATAS